MSTQVKESHKTGMFGLRLKFLTPRVFGFRIWLVGARVLKQRWTFLSKSYVNQTGQCSQGKYFLSVMQIKPP